MNRRMTRSERTITVIKSELVDRYPLLDEVAVIDSGSTDKTLDIAAGLGAKTFLASDYLQEEGTVLQKVLRESNFRSKIYRRGSFFHRNKSIGLFLPDT